MDRISAFRCAGRGIVIALREEPNLKIHFLATILVICLGLLFDISKVDWALLVMAIMTVIVTELLNTAIEGMCDHVTPEQHPMIKKIKDIAAGAVLVSAIGALFIGLIVFIPIITNLL